jgi:PAS domain-containing protein
MINQDNESKWSEQVAKVLPQRVRLWLELLPSVMEILRRLAVPVQLILALLGLALATYYGYHWGNRFTEISKRIDASLQAKLDNTVWQHKGLAAFLLPDIDPRSGSLLSVSEGMRGDLDKIARLIEDQKKTTPDIESVIRMESPTALRKTTANIRRRGLHVFDNHSGDIHGAPINQAVIAGDESFFLFLPVTALRRAERRYEPLNNNSLRAAINHNPDILQDLDLARRLITMMPELDDEEINGRPVVQSYFITESGLILIRSRKIPDQFKFYEKQFDTNHNFTDRPYFWNAVKRQPSSPKSLPQPFQYASEPYIDLGGHGLVKTYSKAFDLANRRFGVLCIDVTESELKDEVIARLNVLRVDREPLEVDFVEINPNGDVSGRKAPADFKWFYERLDKTSQATLLGKIAFEKDFVRPPDDVLRYTIPWSTELRRDGSRRVELMLVRIDLKRFWEEQNWHFVFACIGAGVFLAVTLNILQDYHLLKKEISELSYKIDSIMTQASNPYVRLNSENEFVFTNRRFLDLLGYNNQYELEYAGVGARRTFRSILSEESQREYDKVLKTSVSGWPTNEYPITLIRRDGSKIKALVQGERIVFPTIRRKKYPHRFGIVISWQEVNHNEEERP